MGRKTCFPYTLLNYILIEYSESQISEHQILIPQKSEILGNRDFFFQKWASWLQSWPVSIYIYTRTIARASRALKLIRLDGRMSRRACRLREEDFHLTDCFSEVNWSECKL